MKRSLSIIRQLLFEKRYIFLIIGLISVSLFSIGAYKSSYNSDDVAQQTVLNTWRENGTTHETFLTPDPWVLKWPVYEIRKIFIPENSRKTVLIDSWIQNVGLLVCLFVVYRYFTNFIFKDRKRISSETVPSKLKTFFVWIPFVWFYSLGDSLFAAFFRMPNTRNFEIGLLLLLFMMTHYIYEKIMLGRGFSKNIIFLIIAYIIASSLLFLSDPYCLIFLAILTVSYLGVKALINRSIPKATYILVGSLFSAVMLYYLLKYIMSTTYGIHSAHTTGGLIGLSALSKSLELVAWSISYINGIDFTSIRIFNILIPIGATAVIIYALSKKQIKLNSVSIAFFVTALAVVGAAVVSGNMLDKTSARYLVLTVPLMILILGMSIAGIDVKTKKQKNLLYFYFGILVIAIAFNAALMVKSALQTVTRSYDVSDINENATGTNVPKADTQYIHDSSLVNILDYKIIDTLKSKGLTKGYSNYWRSNILTYLSNESVDVNSIICEGQDRYPEPYKWLSTSEDYRPSDIDRTYIIYDDAYLNYVSSCNKEKLGEPLERFNITSRVIVEVYKGDIARTF